ncbi:unnamed protein product [Choristocarpus tenellus]
MSCLAAAGMTGVVSLCGETGKSWIEEVDVEELPFVKRDSIGLMVGGSEEEMEQPVASSDNAYINLPGSGTGSAPKFRNMNVSEGIEQSCFGGPGVKRPKDIMAKTMGTNQAELEVMARCSSIFADSGHGVPMINDVHCNDDLKQDTVSKLRTGINRDSASCSPSAEESARMHRPVYPLFGKVSPPNEESGTRSWEEDVDGGKGDTGWKWQRELGRDFPRHVLDTACVSVDDPYSDDSAWSVVEDDYGSKDLELEDEGEEEDTEGCPGEKGVRFVHGLILSIHEVRPKFERHELAELFYSSSELEFMYEDAEREEWDKGELHVLERGTEAFSETSFVEGVLESFSLDSDDSTGSTC